MATTVSDPLIGRLVDSRYEITARIARGGMATVYRALDRRLDRVVALKIMHPHLGDGVDVAARFRREARAAARLAHPGVVGVFDQGSTDEMNYLTMEFVDGTNLRAVLRRRGALPVGEALQTVERILDALAAAHRAGLVHRDVKPENILVTTEGEVKVADFGLARAVSEATVATTGSLLGTVAYLSPEIVTDGEADARADVYAVGAMLYELLTGHQPFEGDTPIQIAYQHVHGTVPAPSEAILWLPYQVDELVATLTARDPADRPADAGTARNLVHRVRTSLGEHDLLRQADTATSPEAAPSPSSPDTGELEGAETTAVGHTGTIALPVGAVPLTEESQEQAPPRRRVRRGRVLLVVLLVLLLAGLGGVGTWWYLNIGPGAYTQVPDLIGAEQDQAETTLSERDLDFSVQTSHSDDVPEGSVISTDPGPGLDVRRDGEVQVEISLGVQMLEVPDVVGAPEEEALAQLEEDGFSTAGAVQRSYHQEVEAGRVISADPEPGEQVRHDTEVTLTISQGREPIDVPDVTGAAEEEAAATLEDAGAVAQVDGREYSDDVPEGHVLEQTVTGEALRGDVVHLTLSRGPELFEVPDVVGDQFGDAEDELTGIGFDVRREDTLGGFFGTVRLQSVEPGEMVPAGTVIVLTVV
ncbi:MAG TPA: Stk1 family PASTA domain-containing Ser/Thr kinase [Candidatus Ruania gallistercoris]|uniref:non-specific serine/threonine protein kinase n=1 Tax=Candidatus Ruania gallistercoris TaxID=2838746 RepID=A0A9D2J5T9_9MICO|nr:Stk1 family PASTA domain-containing Ser/Thr kinase [Candidatus Ruania gallistercoris]